MCSTWANLPRFFEQEEELHRCERTAVGRRAERMRTSEKDRLAAETMDRDRKSTRLNSSHLGISYAVFCLKDTATTEIYTLSLHDALPICCERTAVGRRAERMRTSEKDRLAAETMD